MTTSTTLPFSSGIGLKPEHYSPVLEACDGGVPPSWVEVHPQNYFGEGGPPHRWLGAIADRLPLSLHSTGLSLGSADGCNRGQLEALARLVERYPVAMISDHLSWSGDAHDMFPDLMPVPYTRAVLDHFVGEVNRVQDRLGRSILIENPSRYLAYARDELDETNFLTQLCTRTGCRLLLDINNVEVSATNLGFSADAYLDAVDPRLVGEIHLAGHAREDHAGGALLIDDHGSIISDACWDLFSRFIARAGPRPTLIEWDTDVPDFATLMAERERAQSILDGGYALARAA